MGTLASSLARRRMSLWGLLAVTAAAATGLAVYSYLSWLRAQVPVAGRLVPLVVAAHDLDPGRVITSGDLGVSRHPERYLPPGALRTTAAVLGRVVAVPIFEGEAVTSRKIGARGGLSSIVPKGMRAYTLSIDSGATLGFAPKPGDRVDVIVTFPREVLGEASSITALRSREVAAVGGPKSGSGRVANQLGLDGASGSALTITLFLTPAEAERLAMAEALGRITIVLAPLGDETEPAPAPVRPRDLIAG